MVSMILCHRRTSRTTGISFYQWFLLTLGHPAIIIYPRSEKNVFKDDMPWCGAILLAHWGSEVASPEEPEVAQTLLEL